MWTISSCFDTVLDGEKPEVFSMLVAVVSVSVVSVVARVLVDIKDSGNCAEF